MKMTFNRILAAMAAFAGLTACVDENIATPETAPEGTSNKVVLRFEVEYPQPDPDTKVMFDSENRLAWTGEETMSVLVGNTSTTSKETGLQLTLNSVAGSPGVFEGEVDLGTFTVEDIRGVVVPAENGAYHKYEGLDETTGEPKHRIMMNVPTTQTLSQSDVFNPQYIPFYAAITSSDLVKSESSEKYTISGLQLSSGTDLLRLNVYGDHPLMEEGEVIKSIKLYASGKITGETRKTIGVDGIGSGGPSYVVTEFTGSATIKNKTQENGTKLFTSVIFGGNRTFNLVEITTDKAVYAKSVSWTNPAQNNEDKLVIYKIGLDLSTFSKYGAAEYSLDNTTWTTTIPSPIEGGKLYVRTASGASLSESELSAIATTISKSEDNPVELDMSESTYLYTTFPNVFAGTSSDASYTALKSIKFPSNVTAIADQAFYYCTGLESVDLSTITKLGKSSFESSGLKSVRVDKQIISFGQYTFRNCFHLEEIYFNAQDPIFKEFGTSKRVNFYTFAFSETYRDSHTVDLVATIGPDIVLPRYCFSNNANLVKIIYEYNGSSDFRMGNNSVIHNRYLETIIFKGTTGRIYMSDGYGKEMGQGVDANTTKYMVVPDGCSDHYTSHTDGIYSKVNPLGYEIIEQSAYDALQQ